MSQDQFLLKWNNHQNNFVEVFNFLRTQDAFVDVTLACDGKSFSAHKVVLSACSPYFQALFQGNPCKHPIVFLKDVKSQDMEALIEFIYKGEVSVSQTELGSLISTAENLKIKGLAEPERPPIEKTVKRLASPPSRIHPQTIQHAPIALLQQHTGSPNAKRKRMDPYCSSHIYTNSRILDKDEKLLSSTMNTDNGPSQVMLVPQLNTGSISSLTPTDLSSQQTYVSHHTSFNSEALLCSVSGPTIYVDSTQVEGRDLGRDSFPASSDSIHNNGTDNEDTIPGPSGIQSSNPSESPMSIKLEPSVSMPPDWDGSNQSYDDGAGSDGGGGGVSTPTGPVVGSSSDHLTLSLPSLHSELTDATQIQDSTVRIAAARALLTVLGASNPRSKSSNSVNEGINKGFSIPGRCKICGESIPRGEHRSHMALHTGHRPLHCTVCGRGFHQTEDLKRHIRVHTGEKPYKCSTCGVAFRQRGHLSRHIFKYHPGIDNPIIRSSRGRPQSN